MQEFPGMKQSVWCDLMHRRRQTQPAAASTAFPLVDIYNVYSASACGDILYFTVTLLCQVESLLLALRSALWAVSEEG